MPDRRRIACVHGPFGDVDPRSPGPGSAHPQKGDMPTSKKTFAIRSFAEIQSCGSFAEEVKVASSYDQRMECDNIEEARWAGVDVERATEI